MSEFASVRALQRLFAIENNEHIPYSFASDNYYLHKYDEFCPICGEKKYMTKHHVKPTRQGGANTMRNYFYVCRDCHDIIDSLKPSECRYEYVKTVLKMFKILHTQFPEYYYKSYTYWLLWESYGISLYEINIYCLIEYIQEYKGNPFYLYVKLLRYNRSLPNNQKIIFSYDFDKNRIHIDKVTFPINIRYHGVSYQTYRQLI